MGDDHRTHDQLQADLAEARSDQRRLLALLEALQAEASQERTHHREERSQLERTARSSQDDLTDVRREAAEGRAQMKAEVDLFKLDVDEQLKQMARYKLRSERIVENLPVGIAYLDKALTYRWANPAFVQLIKRPVDQVLGHAFHEAFPDAGDRVGELLREVIATGQPNLPVKLPFVHAFKGPDNTTHWDLLALPLKGEDDAVDGVLVAIEVTEWAERERLQREKIHNMNELDVLKSEFVSMISHELRTPLSAIAGYAEFLHDNLSGPLTADQRTYVEAIQEAEGRVRAIVDDLLDFARLEGGMFKFALQPLDLATAVRDELVLLAPKSLAGAVHPHLETSGQALPVLADPRRLGQVILNLVGNAIKFTPAGGSVTVMVDATDGSGRVRVMDTGIGIAPEQLTHVFDKFYQVDSSNTRERGGAGLGLAIARLLVERMGGHMGVESEPGKGSTFWFTLPLQPAADR